MAEVLSVIPLGGLEEIGLNMKTTQVPYHFY